MCTYLTKRGTTYYFRRVIPDDVLPYFDGRKEWVHSLGTKDRAEGKRRAQEAAVETNRLIDEARAKLQSGEKPAPARVKRRLTPEELEQRRERERARERAEFEFMVENDRFWAERDHELRYGRYRDQGKLAEARRAGREEVEAEIRLARQERAKEQAAARAPIMELFDGYVSERKPAPATVKRWRPVMSHLVAYLGHDDAARMTPDDVVKWKERLLSEVPDGGAARNPRTVRETYLAALNVILGWAAENRRIPANVAANVTVRVPKKARLRDPGFTDEEATTILKAALEPQSGNLSREHTLARRWVPWLCAYTGARVNEITQLRGQDVQEVEGVWTIRITPEAGGVKSNAARVVPLHLHLVEQGFTEVAKAAGDNPIFYDPERKRGGSEGNPHYKKVGERLARLCQTKIGTAGATRGRLSA